MPKKTTILLIEDELHLVDMYKMSLEAAGFLFESASTTQEGLEKAKKIKPEIILLDIVLPVNNEPVDVYKREGYELLKKFKNDSQIKNIPVIVLTNLDSKQERETAEELHAEAYWVKSQLLPKEIVDGIKRILKKKGK